MKIHYVIGNAVRPHMADGNSKVICHICNDEGGWGSGFVVALSQEYVPTRGQAIYKDGVNIFNSPEQKYREWSKSRKKGDFVLGQIQLVYVKKNITVCNMIAQRSMNGLYEERIKLPLPNVNYSSLLECLTRLKIRLTTDWKSGKMPTTIHMPRIGCGLGGGTWSMVERVIQVAFHDTDLDIYVYDLPAEAA